MHAEVGGEHRSAQGSKHTPGTESPPPIESASSAIRSASSTQTQSSSQLAFGDPPGPQPAAPQSHARYSHRLKGEQSPLEHSPFERHGCPSSKRAFSRSSRQSSTQPQKSSSERKPTLRTRTT